MRGCRSLDQRLRECGSQGHQAHTRWNRLPAYNRGAHRRQRLAKRLQTAPAAIGTGCRGCDRDDFSFELARADHPVDGVLQCTRKTEPVLGRSDENGVALAERPRQRATLSGTPLASRSGLKCGRSPKPAKNTTSTPGGINAAAVFKSARFPDPAFRLPQTARIRMLRGATWQLRDSAHNRHCRSDQAASTLAHARTCGHVRHAHDHRPLSPFCNLPASLNIPDSQARLEDAFASWNKSGADRVLCDGDDRPTVAPPRGHPRYQEYLC